MRACRNCSAEFDPGNYKTKVFCSPECRKAAFQKRHLEYSRIANRKSYHLHRAERIAKRNTPEKRAYHKEYCKQYHLKHREKLRANGIKYNQKNAERRKAYMREYNRRADTLARMAAYREKHRERINTCARSYKQTHPERFQQYYSAMARKRREMVGDRRETISRLIVFERDKWHCQLCGCKTPKSLLGKGTYAPNSPTIDHIIPIMKGGAHLYSNVQLACYRCNSKKRDKIKGQLRLI